MTTAEAGYNRKVRAACFAFAVASAVGVVGSLLYVAESTGNWNRGDLVGSTLLASVALAALGWFWTKARQVLWGVAAGVGVGAMAFLAFTIYVLSQIGD